MGWTWMACSLSRSWGASCLIIILCIYNICIPIKVLPLLLFTTIYVSIIIIILMSIIIILIMSVLSLDLFIILW
jgi:hypothetical protein